MAIDYLISHGSVEQAPINWLSIRPTNHWCVYELFQLNQVHGTRIVCFRPYQSWNTSACFEFGVGWGWWWWWWWWWCTKSTSTVALFFQVFLNHKNTIYLLNITYIFDRCHRSLAGATVVQVECDLRDLTNIFARSKISLTDKITNPALVTPPSPQSITTAGYPHSILRSNKISISKLNDSNTLINDSSIKHLVWIVRLE